MRKIRFIILAAVALTIVSCNKEENINSPFSADSNAVNIEALISDNILTRSNPISTDTDTRIVFNTGDKINVTAEGQETVTYVKQEDDTWIPEDTDKYIKWENTQMSFSAYYPVQEGSSLTDFILPTDQSDNMKIATADYMTIKDVLKDKPADNQNVDLAFNRQTALININITSFGSQYKYGEKTVSDVKIYSGATSLTDDSEVAITAYTKSQIGDSNSTYSAIVLPSAEKTDKTFITLTDGTGITRTVNIIPATAAGYRYTYNLKVGHDSIAVSQVSVKPWTTGTDITGGDADFIAPIPFIDKNFEDAVIAKAKSEGYTAFDTVTKINLNKNKQLEILASITVLDISNKSIENVNGIEYLTGLTDLNCSSNSLQWLNISNNTNLIYLDCSNNVLTSLDVDKNIKLTHLECYKNEIRELNIDKNIQLIRLECYSNKLTKLNVNNNTELKYFYCNSNSLATLNVDSNPLLVYLYCDSNKLTTLNVDNNTSLKMLDCHNNSLTTLNINKNVLLNYLFCNSNNLTALNVEINNQLIKLYCNNNNLSTLNVDNSISLTYLSCYSNSLTTLNVDNNTKLTDLYCYDNSLATLNIDYNTKLKYLNCSNNQLDSLDFSKTTIKYYQLYCGLQIYDNGTDKTLNLTLNDSQTDRWNLFKEKDLNDRVNVN